MRSKPIISGFALMLGVLLVANCGGVPPKPEGTITVEPTPQPTPSAAGDTVGPPDPARARDAALAYLAAAYAQEAPTPGLVWEEEPVTQEGLVGSSSFEYRSGDWLVTVSFPLVAPESTIYQVIVANEATGFHWEGEVDAWMGVMAAPTGATVALGAVVDYVGEKYGQQLPAPGMGWTEERATAEGLVGGETFEYRFEDWLVTISYPVVAPQATIYHVTVTSEAAGFHWEGDVDASGRVTELVGPEGGQAGPVEVSDADLAELAGGNSAFAFDLYQVLRQEQGNLFFSPYSISLALGMTYAGARGETEQEMADALHFLLGQQRLHPAFRALDLALAKRGEGAGGMDGEGFRLNVANALWGQEGESFLAGFLQLVEENYGAGMRLVDYGGAPEEARVTINDWVSEETEGRIEDLIPPGVFNELTRLVLTNAIYFNAAWAEKFDADATSDGPFYLLDGGEVTVPLMARTAWFPYAEGDGYQAVELPYDGRELSMVILLPESGRFEAFDGALSAEQVDAILEELEARDVAVTLPRFEFESSFSLAEALSALGMAGAFTGAADFSGMTATGDLYISEVLHKAFVSVDEAGTEAGAATAVIMPASAAPEEPVQVTVDRPFLFLIRDWETGTILFAGRVVDPSG